MSQLGISDDSRFLRIFPVILIGVVLVIANTAALGFDGGAGGDSNSDGSGCLSCHARKESTVFSFTHSSYTVGSGTPRIILRLMVDFSGEGYTPETIGVMILTGDNKLPEEDGWTIVRDPRNGPEVKNYIEEDYEERAEFIWQVTNTPGKYEVKAMLYYGSESKPHYIERIDQVTVHAPVYNSPPVLEKTSVTSLTEDTYLFEVVYSDPEGDDPEEIWVNLSGLGAYRMEAKNTSNLNWSQGVLFSSVIALDGGKYSYHLSAFDGKNWTETNKSVFYVQKTSEAGVEEAAILFALLFGTIAAAAVIILRRK